MDTIYKLQTIKISLKISDAPLEKNPLDTDRASSILRSIYRDLDADQEHFTILCLNGKNRVTGFKTLFSGGTWSTTVDAKIVFRTALLMGAVNLVICHNHPSGDPTPSIEDKSLTALLESLGNQLQLKIVDHIILGSGRRWSFAAERWRIRQRNRASR